MYTVLFAEGLRSSFPPLVLYKKILESSYLCIPLINIRNKKNGTLDSVSIIISISKTGNIGMNFSTGWMKLVHLANNQTVAHEVLPEIYFPSAS